MAAFSADPLLILNPLYGNPVLSHMRALAVSKENACDMRSLQSLTLASQEYAILKMTEIVV